jgi:hypothetical protein
MTPFRNDEVISARYHASLPRLGRCLRGHLSNFFWFAFVNETLQYFVTIVYDSISGAGIEKAKKAICKELTSLITNTNSFQSNDTRCPAFLHIHYL